jgi:biopolymer transport protein ExbD
MKKYSKSAHHSLNELNITPLLDLAFVLLVIFIITTTPVVNDLELNLPSASSRPKDAPKKPNYVTVDGSGKIFLNMKEVDLIALQQLLVQLREQDPDLSVVVRGDSAIQYQKVVSVLDMLQQANVTKVGLATEPLAAKK